MSFENMTSIYNGMESPRFRKIIAIITVNVCHWLVSYFLEIPLSKYLK
jgi:hypothetical protein